MDGIWGAYLDSLMRFLVMDEGVRAFEQLSLMLL